MPEIRYFRPRHWSKFQSRSNNSMSWVKKLCRSSGQAQIPQTDREPTRDSARYLAPMRADSTPTGVELQLHWQRTPAPLTDHWPCTTGTTIVKIHRVMRFYI